MRTLPVRIYRRLEAGPRRTPADESNALRWRRIDRVEEMARVVGTLVFDRGYITLSGLVLRTVAHKAAISMPDNFHSRSLSRLKINVEAGMASSSGWSSTMNVLKSS
jgi:hypothetical protein